MFRDDTQIVSRGRHDVDNERGDRRVGVPAVCGRDTGQLGEGQAAELFALSSLVWTEPADVVRIPLPKNRVAARRKIREACPPIPGVYAMLDPLGSIIYVGKSKTVRQRLLSYLAKHPADPKARRIIDHAAEILWQPSEHEFIALVRELELIRRFGPWFNRRGKPNSGILTYLCLGREPAPYLFLSRRRAAKCIASFGPFRGTRRLARVVRWLNRYFHLRDCGREVPIRFSNDRFLLPVFDEVAPFRCPRFEMQDCMAPCLAACSREDYDGRVETALQFLRRQEEGPLAELTSAMQRACDELRFEEAARLRDIAFDVEFTLGRLDRINQVRKEFSFIYPVTGASGRRLWCLVRGGVVVGVIDEPASFVQKSQLSKTIQSIYDTDVSSTVPEDVDILMLVAGWFRKYPGDLDRTISPSRAVQMTQTSMFADTSGG